MMTSSEILSQALSSITSIKLDEISDQRSSFEQAKAKLLNAANQEPNQRKKVQILLDGIEELTSNGMVKESPFISLKNFKQFIEQAACDPSI